MTSFEFLEHIELIPKLRTFAPAMSLACHSPPRLSMDFSLLFKTYQNVTFSEKGFEQLKMRLER